MPTHLTPFVYWAQSEERVFIKIDLRDAKAPDIKLDVRKFNFTAKGIGAHGEHNYGIDVDFYADIDPEQSECKLHETKIDFNIKKINKSWWPRLISTPQKPAWLKIDFDRWQSEENLDDDDNVRDIREDYPKLYKELQQAELGYVKESMKKVYLIIYNLFMYVGYMYIFIIMGISYIKEGPDCFPTIYTTVGGAMCFLQLLQFLEVLHPLFRYTDGSVLMPLMQIGGRAIVLFCLIDAEERMQTKPVIFYLFFIWTAIEIVRYPYYLFKLLKVNSGVLTWLRYTLWIPLYPVGFVCEGIIILRSLPYLEETKRFTITLPNRFNFSFDFVTALKLYMLLFTIPLLYTFMSHMYKARVKKIGPCVTKKVK